MKIFILLSLLIITSTVHSAVPYEFFPDQAAKAAEVNANFGDLDTRVNKNKNDITLINSDITAIESDLGAVESDVTSLSSSLSDTVSVVDSTVDTVIDLDDRVTTLEEVTPSSSDKCAPTERKTFYNDKINYSYQSATVGSLLSIGAGTDNYRLVKFPVRDVVSGKEFIVTFPTKVEAGILKMGFYIGSDVWGNCAEDIIISGYPATIEMNETLKYSFNYGTEENEISKEIYFDVIKINLGGIHLSSSIFISEGDSAVVLNPAAASYDLTGLDLSGYVTSDSAFTILNELISYIKIEEVTP